METTKNKISPYAKQFFDKLSSYLETKLYFYGSVQRNDYFPNSSDIDVDIFTDNESSTILKLQNFLKVKRSDFKRIVYRLHRTDQLVTGTKLNINLLTIILK
jgi:predicted nucleotidyltransferase